MSKIKILHSYDVTPKIELIPVAEASHQSLYIVPEGELYTIKTDEQKDKYIESLEDQVKSQTKRLVEQYEEFQELILSVRDLVTKDLYNIVEALGVPEDKKEECVNNQMEEINNLLNDYIDEVE